jgi:hypothetical protein
MALSERYTSIARELFDYRLRNIKQDRLRGTPQGTLSPYFDHKAITRVHFVSKHGCVRGPRAERLAAESITADALAY